MRIDFYGKKLISSEFRPQEKSSEFVWLWWRIHFIFWKRVFLFHFLSKNISQIKTENLTQFSVSFSFQKFFSELLNTFEKWKNVNSPRYPLRSIWCMKNKHETLLVFKNVVLLIISLILGNFLCSGNIMQSETAQVFFFTKNPKKTL